MQKEEKEYIWDMALHPEDPPVRDGDIRIVEMSVQCDFEWSDKIAADYDNKGNVLEYRSGYIMRVLPNQAFVYDNEESTFVASTIKDDNKQKSNIKEQGEQLRLHSVSNSIATEYAEFCVRCDRERLPLLCLEDYIKQFCS